VLVGDGVRVTVGVTEGVDVFSGECVVVGTAVSVTVDVGCGGMVFVGGMGVGVVGTAVFVTTATCSSETGSSDSEQAAKPRSKTRIPMRRLIVNMNFFAVY
jgi:hypothetical protein